jgi:hypothetical protein
LPAPAAKTGHLIFPENEVLTRPRLLHRIKRSKDPPALNTRFASPVREKERRWLDGLYLDVPEEWDDPYRFFRW